MGVLLDPHAPERRATSPVVQSCVNHHPVVDHNKLLQYVQVGNLKGTRMLLLLQRAIPWVHPLDTRPWEQLLVIV